MHAEVLVFDWTREQMDRQSNWSSGVEDERHCAWHLAEKRADLSRVSKDWDWIGGIRNIRNRLIFIL